MHRFDGPEAARPKMRGHAGKRPTILPERRKLLWNLHDLGGVLKRVGEAASQPKIVTMPGLFLVPASDNLAHHSSDTLHPTLSILGFICKSPGEAGGAGKPTPISGNVTKKLSTRIAFILAFASPAAT